MESVKFINEVDDMLPVTASAVRRLARIMDRWYQLPDEIVQKNLISITKLISVHKYANKFMK